MSALSRPLLQRSCHVTDLQAAVSARRMSRGALQHCVTNQESVFRSCDLYSPIRICLYCSSALLMSGKNGPSDDDKWCHEYPVTRHVTHTWHGPSSPEPINRLPKRYLQRLLIILMLRRACRFRESPLDTWPGSCLGWRHQTWCVTEGTGTFRIHS